MEDDINAERKELTKLTTGTVLLCCIMNCSICNISNSDFD